MLGMCTKNGARRMVHGEWCMENVHGKMKTCLRSHQGANAAGALESVFLAIYGAYRTPATPFGNNVTRLPWTEPSCNTGQSRNLHTNLTVPTAERDQLRARRSLPQPRASASGGTRDGLRPQQASLVATRPHTKSF